MGGDYDDRLCLTEAVCVLANYYYYCHYGGRLGKSKENAVQSSLL